MKAILASLLLLSASAALADKHLPPLPTKKPVVDECSKLNLGTKYGLKQRATALPDADAVAKPEAKPLSENQVGDIVRTRAEDLEYCWLRLPASKRVVSAAILHLEIQPTGKVSGVEVNGDLPAGVGKCITQMVNRWTFPTADTATVIDHGLMLTTSSQKIR